ncbi:MAG: hypothetical protein WBW32_10825 [Luteibacter sp.]
MNREQWKDIEQRLTFPGAMVTLECDTYTVQLLVMRRKMRMEIWVYVNGEVKREYLLNDCDIRRRFMRPEVKKPRITDKQLRAHGKRVCARFVKDNTFTIYDAAWPSLTPLRRHFAKHNSRIERVDDDARSFNLAHQEVAEDGQSASIVVTNIHRSTNNPAAPDDTNAAPSGSAETDHA